MNQTPVIEIQDLRKVYREGWFGRPFEALKGVSFRVERGQVFGLLGPNGAGKTTIIKILLGIARKTGGDAQLLGRNAGDRDSRERVGYLPEHLRIAPHHNAWTALELYGRLSGCSKAQIRARGGELLEQVGLADRAHDRVKKYSKGMLQRLGLAQALLHDPELLILDEPTDGLDPIGRKHIRVMLNRLKEQGKTVFLNSHLLQEVELVCDRVAILDRGELREVADISDLVLRTHEQVDVLVLASVEAAQAACAGLPCEDFRGVSPTKTCLMVKAAETSDVDAVVDALRGQGFSVTGIAPRKLSLEDAFVQIIDAPGRSASPAGQEVGNDPNPAINPADSPN